MSQNPDIAILSPLQSKPGRTQGGIEGVVANLANHFHMQGLQVDILVYPPKGAESHPPEIDPEINVVNLHAQHKFTSTLAVAKYLRTHRPRVLLAAGHRCNLIAARAKRWSGADTRIVLSVHNTMSQKMRELSTLKRWSWQWTIPRTYPKADAIVAVSSGVADDMATHFQVPRDIFHVIYNPVLTPELLQRAEETVAHRWFQNKDIPVLLAVGRLRPQKDYPTLLRAFAKLRQQREVRLIILGEGRLRPMLESLRRELDLEDSVDMPGFAPNPLAYMRQASLFVLSSAWEGFGNVLVEAMAVGLQVVSTDCPSGPREILEDGKYGPLVPVGDDEALAQAIAKSLDNPPNRDMLIQSAQRFQIDTVANAYRAALLNEGN